MLDKDPVKMATIVLIISFIFFSFVIYLINPLCIQVVDKNTGEILTSYKLVLSYSLTFAIVISIATLLIASQNNKSDYENEYNINDSFLPPNLAKDYNG